MKNYLKALRWCIWSAALLPLVCYACYTILLFGVDLYEQFIFIVAYIALFVWAGSKAAQANYSISKSAFAGPTLLVMSQLLVSTLLEFITNWPTLTTDRPLWASIIKICLSVMVGFLFYFPIALGFSALGAFLQKKDVI
jgi:hypothetical protein